MGEKGKALLAALKPGPETDADKDHDDQEGEVSHGQVAAMKDFHTAHAANDHEGMATAMSRFLTIYDSGAKSVTK